MEKNVPCSHTMHPACTVCWWVLVLSGPEQPADFFAGLQNISWNQEASCGGCEQAFGLIIICTLNPGTQAAAQQKSLHESVVTLLMDDEATAATALKQQYYTWICLLLGVGHLWC